MKSDYEPSQRRGVNTFTRSGELVTIVYCGGFYDRARDGQIVLMQRSDGLFWFGRTWKNCFVFELETPVTVLEAFAYLSALRAMHLANATDEFSCQGELPF
ncbi:TPA: hypothetical protein MM158_004808 [Klebsiella pneumoniae]|nr:hypothetical protein [Klebsiella pneumoniae]